MGFIRKSLNWYARLSPGRGKRKPPYEHVVQIGDPTLRSSSQPVPLENIKTEEIQNIIKKLQHVLHRYSCVGMSAPQIGVNWRIFIMQLTKKHLSSLTPEEVKNKGMYEVPNTVFINPTLKVVDYMKLIRCESCESVRGFAADVPRFKAVTVTGYDAQGEPITRTYNDWAARIAQHEIDHLDGKLYVDSMDRKTLHCMCWQEVNLSNGKVMLPFKPE